MSKPIRAIIEGITAGLASIFFAVILWFIPQLMILAILFPLPFIIAGARNGAFAGIIGLAIPSALAGFLISPMLGIILFVLNIFILLSLMVVYKKSLVMNEAIILAAGGTLLALLAALQIFNWMQGESFFEYFFEQMRVLLNANSASLDAFIQMYKAIGLIDKAVTGEGFVEVLIEQMRDLMPLVPSALMTASLLSGGINYLVSRALLKKIGTMVPVVSPFRMWALPKGTGRGFLGLMLAAFLGNLAKIPNFDVVLYTVSSIFTFVFTVQGLSAGAFFLDVKKVHVVLKILILGMILVLLPAGLMFVGIFEQGLGLRKAYTQRKGN
ncbi:MAG: DUF2232 domain-containing protein [Clostridiales bacterium]|mgnify:CR=1 FL=1|nr:DUF2232 domain-containing protein [Clostridiales bacterium]